MTAVIGLTGGIASGKSTVARMLAERGATVIDADAIVHELQAPGTPLLAEIAQTFGPEVLAEDGALDRAALADRVFRDPDARRRLDALVHPAVGREIGRRLREAFAADTPLVVLDIPLLLESRERGGPVPALDAVVVVWVPEEVQVERQLVRNGYGREEALRRVRAQLPLDRKRELADRVIDNSGTPADTERQVEALLRELAPARPDGAKA